MKLTLGPILFYWQKQFIYEFYANMLATPVDVIYLGETVCGKRHELTTNDWIDLARELADISDKELVLSSLSLIESNADLTSVRKLCANSNIKIEANDMASVHLLAEQNVPFICGPSVNIYNHYALNLLQQKGMTRWVMPVELSATALCNILEQAETQHHLPETEVFAFGKLPLAYSARCFSSRAEGIPKDNCQYNCLQHPNGLDLYTQENQGLFTINGIQTLSYATYNLIDELQQMTAIGVSHARISPQFEHTDLIIENFKRALNPDTDANDLNTEPLPPLADLLLPNSGSENNSGHCALISSDKALFSNGYWHSQEGMRYLP